MYMQLHVNDVMWQCMVIICTETTTCIPRLYVIFTHVQMSICIYICCKICVHAAHLMYPACICILAMFAHLHISCTCTYAYVLMCTSSHIHVHVYTMYSYIYVLHAAHIHTYMYACVHTSYTCMHTCTEHTYACICILHAHYVCMP